MLLPLSLHKFVERLYIIQYSNRQEIVNNKSSGDVVGNVLLVTIEGVDAVDATIDVIHLVSFMYVHILVFLYVKPSSLICVLCPNS